MWRFLIFLLVLFFLRRILAPLTGAMEAAAIAEENCWCARNCTSATMHP
jgi:hypothetical protein